MMTWIAALADPTARAKAEADRQQALKDSAASMAKAKAGCAVPLAGTTVLCADPAVGLCQPCSRAFCAPHGSTDIGTVFLRVPDLCGDCQQRLIETSLTEHDLVAATLKARVAQRRAADLTKLKERRRTNRTKRLNSWARRSGGTVLGLVLVVAGGGAGLRVDHVLTPASVPVDIPRQGVTVTPFAILAGIGVVLGIVVALSYATRLGAAAARGALWIAGFGSGYLVATAGLLVSRSRDGELDWVRYAIALGAASLWLIGAYLAHRPAAEARAARAGKAAPSHPDRIVGGVIVALFAVAIGAAAVVLMPGR